MVLEGTVEDHQAGHGLRLHARVRVGEERAAAEAGDEELGPAALLARQCGGGADVLREGVHRPVRHEAEVGDAAARRERGAVVERVDLDAAPGQEDPEVVVLVGQGHLAVHVGAGEIQDRGLGRLRRAIAVHADAVVGAAGRTGRLPPRLADVRRAREGRFRRRRPGGLRRGRGGRGQDGEGESRKAQRPHRPNIQRRPSWISRPGKYSVGVPNSAPATFEMFLTLARLRRLNPSTSAESAGVRRS